jgi:hypothetical protein
MRAGRALRAVTGVVYVTATPPSSGPCDLDAVERDAGGSAWPLHLRRTVGRLLVRRATGSARELEETAGACEVAALPEIFLAFLF